MKIKLHSADLNRMMKIIRTCMDNKNITRSNIQITHADDRLQIRATNGTFAGIVSTALPGGDGDSFCIDGSMFAKVIGLCNGEVEITTDGKNCIVKGTGRTRIPIVDMKIPEMVPVTGASVEIKADDFKYCYGRVSYAIATDISRLMLTGIYMEKTGSRMQFTAMDGFQLAIESMECSGDDINMIVPGGFMDWVSGSLAAGEMLKLTTNGTRIMAETESMTLCTGLLAGKYVDYRRLLPESFKTEIMIYTEKIRDAVKSEMIISTKNNLLKMEVAGDAVTIRGNSVDADYEADISCEMRGEPLDIAFNDKYMINMLNAIDTEEAVIKFNSPVSPVIVQGKERDGIHLCLPVRLMEVST